MEINARTIADAWPEVLRAVLTRGSNQRVNTNGSSRDTLEFPGVITTNIDMPYTEMVPKGSKFTEQALEEYASQLWKPDNKGFVYSYGERLRAYNGIDQLDHIIADLHNDPSSRREVAITWMPNRDSKREIVPCMILTDFKLRNGHLNLTAYFRSHDVYGAFPSNVYGLAKLIGRVASRIDGMIEIGKLTIVSNGAHIYEHDGNSARQIAGVNP